jgi:hypothetical protein
LGSSVTLAGNGQKRWEFQGFGANVVPKAEGYLGNVGEKFLLYVDGARYYSKPVVKEWRRRHQEFRLVPLPAYAPNRNLIERLWKFLRQKALSRWHKTFAAMPAAVSGVLDHLSDYRAELATLRREEFAIVEESARAEACAAA